MRHFNALRLATEADLPQVLPFMAAYHAFEEIDRTDERRIAALRPLVRAPAIGPLALSLVSDQLAADGVHTMLHEVAHGNPRAQKT